ncbi:MAG: hypothetical protein AB2693_34725 [Candidatus Thiodiazotropha sp.]
MASIKDVWLTSDVLPAETCALYFSFKLLGLSDTEEVKYRNAHLSHLNWYGNNYITSYLLFGRKYPTMIGSTLNENNDFKGEQGLPFNTYYSLKLVDWLPKFVSLRPR